MSENISVKRTLSSIVTSLVLPRNNKEDDGEGCEVHQEHEEERMRSDSAASMAQTIDVASLNQSLAYVNPFLYKRIAEKNQPVLMKELLATGAVTTVEMQLRQLLSYVNRIADFIDSQGARKYEPGAEGKLSIVDLLNDEESRYSHWK